MIDNAELIGLSRQTALQRQMNVVANNLANMSTSGFKAERAVFAEYLVSPARMNEFQPPDRRLSYVWDVKTHTEFTPGPVTLTGAPLDVAPGDDAFFVVEGPDGQAFTRNGAFQINTDGLLVTNAGNPVLGEGGPITLPPDEGPVSIAVDGTISTDAGIKGRLAAVTFEDRGGLLHLGDGLFAGPAGRPVTGRFTQGALEGSNVRGVVEMTEMIEVSRAYQSLSNTMKRLDDLRQNAIRSLGTLQA